MDGAFAWIGQIAEWFGQFFPRFSVLSTVYAGVKFRSFRLRDVLMGRGAKMDVVPISAGFIVYWPFATQVHTFPIARQATDLKTQSVTTRDSKSIVVSGLIMYRIFDVEAILAHTFDPDETIRTFALSAIHRACVPYTWQELQDLQRTGEISKSLRRECARELKRFGVKVIAVTLTDLALAKVINLMQSQNAPVAAVARAA